MPATRERHVRTFAIVNQKGGCGKTTTAINLAGVFANKGFRTLLVDMDPQGHCAAGLAIPEQRVDLNIGDAMLAPDDQPVDPQRLLWRVCRNLDLAPSTVRLAALEAARGELANRPDAESRLKRVLERFERGYDLCLIDCSPAIGLLAFNALVAADEIIIPVETGFFSLQGASKQVNAIKALGKRLGGKAGVGSAAPPHNLLATMHDASSVLSQDLLDELRRRFNGRVLPVVIRHDQALREAASFGQPVIEYAPESPGAKDYTALAEHLIARSMPGGGDAAGGAGGPSPARGPASPTIPAHETAPPSGPTPALAPARGAANVGVISGGRGATAASLTAARLAPVLAGEDVRTVAVVDLSGGPEPIRPVQSPKRRGSTGEGHPAVEANPPAPTAKVNPEPAELTRQLQRAAVLSESATRASPIATPPSTVSAAPAVALPSTVRPFGVTVERGIATFRLPMSVGTNVAVAGDFNGWQPERTPMRAVPGQAVLEAVAPIGDSPAQYRLVVDGQWIPDPFNPLVAPNPFGGANSIAREGRQGS